MQFPRGATDELKHLQKNYLTEGVVAVSPLEERPGDFFFSLLKKDQKELGVAEEEESLLKKAAFK